MKTVYEAAHAVEAHMIVDLLRQEHIAGRVEGEYLAGAIGGLPAAGLVRVVVDEDDHERARRVIEGWNAAQRTEAAPPARPDSGGAPAGRPAWPWFAAGLVVGLCAATLANGSRPEATPAELAQCRA